MRETIRDREKRLANLQTGPGILVCGWRTKARMEHIHWLTDPSYTDTSFDLAGGGHIFSAKVSGSCQISKRWVRVSIQACILPKVIEDGF